MLCRERELQASVSTAFSSSPKLSRAIIYLQDTDKSQYFVITESDNSFDHQFCFYTRI